MTVVISWDTNFHTLNSGGSIKTKFFCDDFIETSILIDINSQTLTELSSPNQPCHLTANTKLRQILTELTRSNRMKLKLRSSVHRNEMNQESFEKTRPSIKLRFISGDYRRNQTRYSADQINEYSREV